MFIAGRKIQYKMKKVILKQSDSHLSIENATIVNTDEYEVLNLSR